MQLWVYRYDPGLAALAPSNPDGGSVGVQRQIPRLDRERLGISEPSPPFDQELQPRPGVRGRSDQGVNLVSFQVLRELPGRLLLRVSTPVVCCVVKSALRPPEWRRDNISE